MPNYADIGRDLSAAEFKGKVITKLEYIEDAIDCNREEIKELKKKTATLTGWQQDFGTKTKFIIGIAVFVGGVFVWIADKTFELFMKRV